VTDVHRIGGTGHIGGAVLDLIYSTFPKVAITVLVRDERKSARLLAKYPSVSIVQGDLDSIELLEFTAHDSDIVISELHQTPYNFGTNKLA